MKSTLTRTLLVLLLASAAVVPALRADAEGAGKPDGQPGRTTFSAQAADWWVWALSAPTPTNPAIDQSGANCATGQRKRGPWYLAGALFPQGPVTRACTIDDDRDLFFPVINLGYFAFLNDPADQRTIDFVRAQVACESGSEGSVTLDGRALAPGQLVHEQSSVFSVQLPTDNVFGLTPDVATDLVLSPSVDQGTYVLLRHLRKGHHTLHIESTLSSACPFTQTNDVTYDLTIR